MPLTISSPPQINFEPVTVIGTIESVLPFLKGFFKGKTGHASVSDAFRGAETIAGRIRDAAVAEYGTSIAGKIGQQFRSDVLAGYQQIRSSGGGKYWYDSSTAVFPFQALIDRTAALPDQPDPKTLNDVTHHFSEFLLRNIDIQRPETFTLFFDPWYVPILSVSIEKVTGQKGKGGLIAKGEGQSESSGLLTGSESQVAILAGAGLLFWMFLKK